MKQAAIRFSNVKNTSRRWGQRLLNFKCQQQMSIAKLILRYWCRNVVVFDSWLMRAANAKVITEGNHIASTV